MGSSAGDLGGDRDAGWRGQAPRPRWHVERTALASEGPRHAQRPWTARRPLRPRSHPRAAEAHRGRAPTVLRAGRRVRFRPEEAAMNDLAPLPPPFGSLSLDAFARAAGLHPDLVRRLVQLGLLEAASSPSGELRLPPPPLAAAARLWRLRAGLALNYAALGVVVDLLDRVASLEAA